MVVRKAWLLRRRPRSGGGANEGRTSKKQDFPNQARLQLSHGRTTDVDVRFGSEADFS